VQFCDVEEKAEFFNIERKAPFGALNAPSLILNIQYFKIYDVCFNIYIYIYIFVYSKIYKVEFFKNFRNLKS